jgi:tRNA(Ile)-lysidine synthetase-like protein
VSGPDPAVAAVRSAVRDELCDLPPGSLILVACSGGPDSLALAAALAFLAPRTGWRAGAVTVDHGWRAGSAEHAQLVADRCRGLGLDPVAVLSAPTARSEGAARDARRLALSGYAAEHGAAAVLLGHTRDDQAETVLLRLARGSGGRSLAGMPRRDARYRRPLLALPRTTTLAACAALGLAPWHDPANDDPAFARTRVRTVLLPALERELGPGIAAALARTADLLRADADALDALVPQVWRAEPAGGVSVAVTDVEPLPEALRSRVLRAAALAAGCPATDLVARHVAELSRLVTGWRGQGPLTLPGGILARRAGGRIVLVHRSDP